MLFARVSILSVCVLAVSAAPARGQSTGGVPHIRCALRMPASSSETPAPTRLSSARVAPSANARSSFDANSLSKFLVGNNDDINIATGPDHEGLFVCLELRSQPRRPRQTPPTVLGPFRSPRERTSRSKFSGWSSWTPFTTGSVPRRQVFRFFWFRSLPADLRTTPLISTPGSRCWAFSSPDPEIGSFQSGGRISAVFFDPTVVADRNGFLLQAIVRRVVQRSVEVRRGSAIRRLRSWLADDAALFLLRWLGQHR